MSKALFPGRFQPFHIGHLDIIKKIVEDGYTPIIAIGSINQHQSRRNPFTKEERTEMIKRSLNGIEHEIAYIKDLGDNKRWIDFILPDLPEFDAVYTNSPLMIKLFQDKGYKVIQAKYNRDLSGSHIRELIYARGSWDHLVPKAVVEYIEEIDGLERVIKLMDEPAYINPRVTVDSIMNYKGNLVLIKRGIYPFKGKLAFPGGHVNLYEHPEDAARREPKEETGLDFEIDGSPRVYTGEQRDPRGPSVAFVYSGKAYGEIKADDDAEEVILIPIRKAKKGLDLAFDHSQILKNYFEGKEK